MVEVEQRWELEIDRYESVIQRLKHMGFEPVSDNYILDLYFNFRGTTRRGAERNLVAEGRLLRARFTRADPNTNTPLIFPIEITYKMPPRIKHREDGKKDVSRPERSWDLHSEEEYHQWERDIAEYGAFPIGSFLRERQSLLFRRYLPQGYGSAQPMDVYIEGDNVLMYRQDRRFLSIEVPSTAIDENVAISFRNHLTKELGLRDDEINTTTFLEMFIH